MKVLLRAVILIFALVSLALAEPVEVGMPEAKLIELKGAPQTKATMGKKAIYRWPDMEVTLIDGKVDQVKFRDRVAERQSATERTKVINSRNSASKDKGTKKASSSDSVSPEGPYEDIYIKVLRTLPGGEVMAEFKFKVPQSSAQNFLRRDTEVCLIGLAGCFDGDLLVVSAAPAGTYRDSISTMRRLVVRSSRKFVDADFK